MEPDVNSIAPVGAFGGKPRSPHWGSVRNKHLQAHPRCEVCGRADMLNVHHVKPYHLFPADELDEDNLITLCEGSSVNCHLLFGHLLNWSAFNEKVRQDAANWATKIAKRQTGAVASQPPPLDVTDPGLLRTL